jgi:putative flippase GtrA
MSRQFSIFLLVGALNTIFGYSVYAIFLFIGLHYASAAFLATCIGVLFNFKTTGRIVFQNTKNVLLFKFIFVYMLIYLINIVFLSMLLSMGINAYIGGAITILPMALLGFFLNQRFVFTQL